MLRTYTTAKNNNLQREFHCCHNISIFLVSLYAKKSNNNNNNNKNHIAFTCVNLPLFILLFIIFIVLFPSSINFEFNFGLNFNTINLFYINCKISFDSLPIKEKSLGLLELASKM